MSKPEDFSFCESTWAPPLGKWHVRRLTDAGNKFGGGIDTPSLCEFIKQGWDLRVPINQFHLKEVVCDHCREALLQEIPLGSFPPSSIRSHQHD